MRLRPKPRPIRIWHDDERPNPEGWVWAQNNDSARRLYRRHEIIEISLDFDLTVPAVAVEVHTGLALVKWMIATDNVPPLVTIHSQNPSGAQAMNELLIQAGHNPVVKPYEEKQMAVSRMEADLEYAEAELARLREEEQLADTRKEERDNLIARKEAEIAVLHSSLSASPEAEEAYMKAKEQEAQPAEEKPAETEEQPAEQPAEEQPSAKSKRAKARA